MSKLTLTASSMACALRCPRRYYYDNILGLKVATPSEALRIGTAVHNGGEARAVGGPFDAQYTAAITGTQLDEWMAAKVFGILGAYCRHYGEIDEAKLLREADKARFITRERASKDAQARQYFLDLVIRQL
jgi:hypothetical protein